MFKIPLHYRILIGMFVGLIAGLLMFGYGDPESSQFQTAVWWLDLFGKDLFIGMLKMIIAPLILASIVAGIYSLPNAREIGNVGIKTVGYYCCTTAIAVAIGITAVLIISPGTKDASQRIRADRQDVLSAYRSEFEAETGQIANAPESKGEYLAYIARQEGASFSGQDFQSRWDRIQSTRERTAGEMFREELLGPIISNPFTALASSPPNALGIIFFSILIGLACVVIGEPAKPVGRFFESFAEVMMKVTLWIMELAPYSIGCIVASLVATLGYDALQALAWYCATVITGIGLHIVMLLVLVTTFGRMSPAKFLVGIRNPWIIGFTTTSSAATLPVTMLATQEKLDVSPKVARFTLPVGATINMDGTALYEGVAVIFLIQVFGGLDDVGITMTAGKTFVIFITAVFASIGAAAVPSAGLITMAIVASAVGLPLYYIFLIYAVDHLLDMFRTSTNVMGDMAGAVIVNRLESGRL